MQAEIPKVDDCVILLHIGHGTNQCKHNIGAKPKRGTKKEFAIIVRLLLEHGWDLTHPFIASRSRNGLQKSIQLKMGMILGTEVNQRPVAQQVERGKRKRCRDCME